MNHCPSPEERRVPRQWRRQRGSQPSLGWRVLASALLAACAESSHIDVPPGGGNEGGAAGEDPRCPEGYVVCGTGCCPSKLDPCMTNEDCSGDTTCGGRECKPWASFPSGQARDLNCRDAVDLPSLRPEVKCQWPGATPPAEFPNSVQVIGTPMVIDFNYDNDPNTHFPSIVFISYEGDLSQVNGVLRVISGRDCSLEETISDPDHPFVPEVSPALGDVDGDGRPDIVAVDIETQGSSSKNGVAVYSVKTGKQFDLLARQNTSLAQHDIKGLSIADVADDNDVPEILTDTGIYAYINQPLPGLAEKANNDGSTLEPPIVHDVDGDTNPELVTSTGIKNWNSAKGNVEDKLLRATPLWDDDVIKESAFLGMADLGEFPTALGYDSTEMILVRNRLLLVAQVDTKVLLRVEGDGVAAGPPVIADFDGDGRMEFASPGLDKITAYDLDCVNDPEVKPQPLNCKNPDGPNALGILWQQPTHGAQSGASVFDFDGDRRSEVVYADQCFLRIMSGLTGEVQFSVPRSSVTRWDYPVIADVDGDTHSEIVTASNDYNVGALTCPVKDELNQKEEVRFVPSHGITVWKDHDQRWAGSRMLWNQHAYSVTNVNDDGTIPLIRTLASQFTSASNDPNTLRQNVQGKTGVSLQLADVTAWVDPQAKCAVNQALATIKASMCNRGTLDIPASTVNLSMLRAGNSTALCTKGNTGVLRSGGCEEVTCEVPVPDAPPGVDIMVLADSTNAVPECIDGKNNITMISSVFCNGPLR